MKDNPTLHNPVFTTLSPPLATNSPRRMAPIRNLRKSKFVDAAQQMVDAVAAHFQPLGYRPVQPSILFNTGEAPAQEPHQDSELLDTDNPTLSVLINPISVVQGLWIAKNSHHPGKTYLEKIKLPPGHAVILRHDVCHAGFAIPKGTFNARVHLNLVHESDTRLEFPFDEEVIPCLRARGGDRFILPSESGEFDHVAHHVYRESPRVEVPAENRHKRKAVSILEAVIATSRRKIEGLETRASQVSAQVDEDRERVATARRILAEHEATLALREEALETINAEISDERETVEGSEFALTRL